MEAIGELDLGSSEHDLPEGLLQTEFLDSLMAFDFTQLDSLDESASGDGVDHDQPDLQPEPGGTQGQNEQPR